MFIKRYCEDCKADINPLGECLCPPEDTQEEMLKELKRIRYMMEELWLSNSLVKKHDLSLSIIEERLKSER